MALNSKPNSVTLEKLGYLAFLLILHISAYPVFAADLTTSYWDNVIFNRQIQTGLDTWQIHKDLGAPGYLDNNSTLNLEDSQPRGTYQNPSPWLKVDAEARTGNLITRLRYDRNQSVGSRVDELSTDWSLHAIGIRTGILGYKVSWCRTHDVDSPWMRENDPFCVARSTSTPIKSAPGIQLYVNTLLGSFKVQSLIGAYRPKLFNYETKEFTNYSSPYIHVTQNNKVGASISAIDLDTGLEMRASYLRSDQKANYNPPNTPTQHIDQGAAVTFLAISKSLNPVFNLRLSYLNSNENSDFKYPAGYVTPGDTFPEIFSTFDRIRRSHVMELNHQYSARDVISIAYSRYIAYDQTQLRRLNGPNESITYYPVKEFLFNNTSHSVSWRRDWEKGIFTIFQITNAKVKQRYDVYPGVTPVQHAQSTGSAYGFRLGYSF